MTERDIRRRSGHKRRFCICVQCGHWFTCLRRGRPRVTCSARCARLHYNATKLAYYYACKETVHA